MQRIKIHKQFWWYFLILFGAVYIFFLAFKEGDFKVFLLASELIENGKSPYGEWIAMDSSSYLQYYYSPFWAVLLFPFKSSFSFLPNFLWLSLNLFFLVRVFILLNSYSPQWKIASEKRFYVLLLSLIFSFRFILYNFELIQMTIFLLWGVLEGIRLLHEEKKIRAAALLALIINIKILPLVILPYLFYKKEFKALSWIIVFSMLYLLIPSLLLGWNLNWFLHSEWFNVINPQNKEHLFEEDLGPHSLTALLPSLLTDTKGTLEFKRNLMLLSPESAGIIINIIRGIFVLSTLYILNTLPFTKSKSYGKIELFEISYILLLIPLIFPHQQKYAFLFALPLQFYLLSYLFEKIQAKKRDSFFFCQFSLLGLSFLLMTLTTDSIVGRSVNEITQHYKLITYGAIVLIISALVLRLEDRKSV